VAGNKAALYARYSTDLQSERSVDDQFALCEEFATRNGYEVAGEYSDRARSGSSTHGRNGLRRLMDDAREGRFDLVIVEALDRLSRDQEDLAGLHKRLSFANVEIIAVHDGRADAVQIGIRGLVSTLFLADLKHKIRRGMDGLVRDGKTAGGRAYGYRPTPGDPGHLQIHEGEAAIVRRIFAEYLDGRSPREIAGRLNADGVPPPRGTKWNASTINGSRERMYGIIQNPLYAGRIVWNRVRMVRDPETGRRVSRVNPQEEWREAEAPQLAIIDAETYEAARARKDARGGPHKPIVRRRKRVLSGLLRCGHCGGGMTMHDQRGDVVRVRCSTEKESGACDNTRRYRLDRIEVAVVGGLLERLRDPALITAYVDAYQAERRDEAKARGKIERKIALVDAQISRLIRRSIRDDVMTDDDVAREMAPLRAEQTALKRQLDAAPAPAIAELHPATVDRYKQTLATLGARLTQVDPVDDREIVDAFRALVDHVIVHDKPDGGVEVEVVGRLSALVGQPAGDAWGVSLVAEEGLEPPTRGL
jgi:DNA invertase Pin-like site-specific DNA recombinase